MVNIGSEVRCRGDAPNRRGWPVKIQTPSPRAGARRSQTTVVLRGRALATRGDYRRYITLDGKRYPNVVDPDTGRPVRTTLASVSILAPTIAHADGLATACLVLGRVPAMKLIERTARGKR